MNDKGSKIGAPKKVDLSSDVGGVPSVKLASGITVPLERREHSLGPQKPYILEIQGKKPNEIPLPRLLEYLKDVGALLGHPDAMHLVGIEDRSTAPVILVDQRFEKATQKRMLAVRTKSAP